MGNQTRRMNHSAAHPNVRVRTKMRAVCHYARLSVEGFCV
jgi:hypothetical protein